MTIAIDYLRYKREHLWKYIDADWKYGFQCMDLIRSYCEEVFWFNMWVTAQARDVNNTHTLPWRKKLIIWKDDFKKWDIITLDLWKYWHIWIVDKTDTTGVYVLEQNWSGKWSWQMIPWNEIRIKKYKRWKIINCFRAK